MLTLIISGLRALSVVAPLVIREGHGDRVAKVLDALATLGERGEEAADDLRALVTKLETIDGVDRQEKEDLWAELESTHNAIQEAAKLIPPDDPPPPPPPPAGDGGGAGEGQTGDSDAGDAGDPPPGEETGGGSGENNQ